MEKLKEMILSMTKGLIVLGIITGVGGTYLFYKSKIKDKTGSSEDDTAKTIDEKDETVKISKADWMALREDLRKTKATLENYQIETKSKMQAEYVRGEASAKTDLEKERKHITDSVFAEAQKIVTQIVKELKRYKAPSALVTGNCIGTLKDGSRYYVNIPGECLTVVHKKVGQNGEINGILEGLSLEARNEGILKFECNAGEAHIEYIEKQCSSAKSAKDAEVESEADAQLDVSSKAAGDAPKKADKKKPASEGALNEKEESKDAIKVEPKNDAKEPAKAENRTSERSGKRSI
jgi:hypothetical protein